jgi:hypothetical protein
MFLYFLLHFLERVIYARRWMGLAKTNQVRHFFESVSVNIFESREQTLFGPNEITLTRK